MEKPSDSGVQKDLKNRKGSGSFLKFRGISESDQTQLCGIAGYLLAMLFVSAVVLFLKFPKGQETDSLIYRMIQRTAASGGIGGTIFCMRGFAKHLVKGDFDINYTVWYLFSPFIGASLGVMSFFFLFGGLIGFSGVEKGALESLKDWHVTALYMGVAFIAGYAVDEFVTKLRDLSKTLFTKVEEDWQEGNTSKAKKTG